MWVERRPDDELQEPEPDDDRDEDEDELRHGTSADTGSEHGATRWNDGVRPSSRTPTSAASG
jgi:hypothetical protein